MDAKILNTAQEKKTRSVLGLELLCSSFFINLLGLAVPLFVIQVLNRYVAHGIDGTLISLVVGTLLAVGLEFAFREVRIRLAGCASTNINRRLGMRSFSVLVNMRGQVLNAIPGKVRSDIMQGLEAIQQATSAPNITALLDVPFAFIYLFAVWLLSPALAVIAVVFIGLAVLVAVFGVKSSKEETQALAKEMSNRRNLIMAATVTGIDTIRAFDAQKYVTRHWREIYSRVESLTHLLQTRQGFMQTTTQSLSALMTVCIIGVGAKLSVMGELNIGVMMGANILAARALMPISRLAQYAQTLIKCRNAMQQLDKFHALPLEAQEGTEPKTYKGDLELVDLSFSHPKSPGPLFESLSVKLPHGSIVAVIGQNGAGKTTMARLIMGLLDPSRGRIIADGVDLRQITPYWWRQHVSYLPQEPSFFDGTIKENILVGVDNVSEEALNSVVQAAGLSHYLDNSAKGLDEIIIDNAKDLSLGLRRRIALARALITNGRLLVFDEPTEGLDAQGQQAMYQILSHKLKKDYTVICFSHDPGILKNANIVIDLNVKPVPRIGINKQVNRSQEGDKDD